MAETQPLTFPLKWDKCPSCGSNRRVADQVKEEEKAKGRVGADLHTALAVLTTLIIDPRNASRQLTAPVLITYLDACAACGALYCVHIDRQEQSLAVMAPGQPGRPPAGPGMDFLRKGHG
ncbi:MAG: hypothetical protein Q8P59_05740 [Dehalococcoidia bacterium]|nr:hypothetical protein [Dehalococcoidia bacterium]